MKELMEKLLNSNVKAIAVISTPDYNGGRQIKVVPNIMEEDIILQDFEYLEKYYSNKDSIWKGRKNTFTEEYHPRYEEPCTMEISLCDLLESLLDSF